MQLLVSPASEREGSLIVDCYFLTFWWGCSLSVEELQSEDSFDSPPPLPPYDLIKGSSGSSS